MEGFPYVLDIPSKPTVAFGSVINLGYWPQPTASLTTIKSATSQSRIYSSFSKDLPSKFGYSAFANKAPRLKQLTKRYEADVGEYQIKLKKPVKQNYKPFNCGETLKKELSSTTPGPGTYPYQKKLPGFNYCLAFGKRRVIWPATAVFCTPKNLAKCFYCEQVPIGDYFYNFKSKTSICRRCVHKQLDNLRQCTTNATMRESKLKELKQFKPVRYCGFYHEHCTKDVTLTLISREELLKKIKLENYLHMYRPVWSKGYIYKKK